MGEEFLKSACLILTGGDKSDAMSPGEQADWLQATGAQFQSFHQMVQDFGENILFVANPPVSSDALLEATNRQYRHTSRQSVTNWLNTFRGNCFSRQQALNAQAKAQAQRNALVNEQRRARMGTILHLSSKIWGMDGLKLKEDQHLVDNFSIKAPIRGNIAKITVWLVGQCLQHWEVTLRNSCNHLSTVAFGNGAGASFSQDFAPKEYIIKCKLGITEQGQLDRIRFKTNLNPEYGKTLGNGERAHHEEEVDPQDKELAIVGFHGILFDSRIPATLREVAGPTAKRTVLGIGMYIATIPIATMQS